METQKTAKATSSYSKKLSPALLGKRHWLSGFTLVELIVVISILAILGTIGFISIQGYTRNTRDSNRVSDINSAMKSLELNQIKSGSYPSPDSSFAVTYSGGAVWNQGVFGAGVLTRLSGVGINKAPVDPLTQSYYTYSLLAYGNAYQIRANYEGDSLSYGPSFVDTAYAASGNPSLALIKGNYGGLIAKTQTGGIIYVLAVPSIITNTGTTGSSYEISAGTLSGTLLIHAGSNKTGILFNPNQVIFSGATLPENDTGSGITNMMTLLKNAYTGTTLANNATISTLLSTPTAGLASLGASVIQNQLGSSASVASAGGGGGGGGGSSNSCATNPSFANLGALTTGSPSSAGQAWSYNATPGNCTYVCTGGYSGTSCATPPVLAYSSATTYIAGYTFTYNGATITVSATGIGTSNTKADSACDTNDIAIWQGGTNNIQVWSACNVGATTTTGYNTVPAQSPNPTATASALPPDRVASVQGNYYQWGRNDNVTSGTWTTSQWGGAFSSPANTTGNTNFYQGDGSYGSWHTPWVNNSNPAGGWNVANGGNNQGPCPAGYHIPTGGTSDNTTEWGMLYTIINSAGTFGSCSQANVYDRTVCAMKLPYAGYRYWHHGQYYSQGTYGFYWSSSPNSTNAYNAYFYSGGGSTANNNNRGYGFSLRCVKN